ncbi:sulfur oxidation c-type cytochrome SoxA [Sedimenticola selenatireducens]|uniref:SoxAX cytochrome complex subunit A n=1 Tax=Sedimenticola selenatireducens TaxID=191960 RepID=A0A558DMX1_9GAMM|nr:sulfur oxidation c-type cytochrome SoxA [Sedimenticola selenatireducens]TVO74830.1 sulfur oxidation c-type cytochrome SoxA [Sedimenticola selenatireducens]TVT62365.1 MAG: sulfur oxidation c-type cytochrome SoxA [Sedimenticola selenatireducens]
MKKLLISLAVLLVTAVSAQAGPEEDRMAFIKYYKGKFPNVPMEEYANGAYAIDPVGRENWEAIEEFPPYEPFIDRGQVMWEKPFANGKGYKDCFPDGPAIAHNYPRWDREQGLVMTLPLALNQCRKANSEKPLKYKKGPINDILSYIAFQSRGKVVNVEVPKDDPRAMAAYEDGKKFYFTRRGQLNFSCATCHVQNTGLKVRTEILSPSVGHITHWPVYRSKVDWGTVGTLHRRFTGCNKNIRAKPMKAQGPEYRNLEYFLSYLSNGLELNGPGARK